MDDLLGLKLVWNRDIRRLSLSTTNISLTDLINRAVKLFPNLRSEIVFRYKDDDNDEITISSDAELKDAIELLISVGNKSCIKFNIIEVEGEDRYLRNYRRIENFEERNCRSLLNSALDAAERLVNSNKLPVTSQDFSILKSVLVQLGYNNKEKTFYIQNNDNSEALLNMSIHMGVKCDGCGVSPILGVRFKCSIRDDFDLCQLCESKADHTIPFLKIYDPKQSPKKLVTILKKEKCQEERGQSREREEQRRLKNNCGRRRLSGEDNACFNEWDRGTRASRGALSEVEKGVWRRGRTVAADDKGLSDSSNGHFPQPISPPKCSSPLDGVPRVKPMARFVRDITLPDGSCVLPGTNVTKIWLMRNDGEIDWPEGVRLVHASGDVLSEELSVLIPLAKVEEEVAISVTLSLPSKPGRYVSYWRLEVPSIESDSDRVALLTTSYTGRFGHRVWADVRVVDNAPSISDDSKDRTECESEESIFSRMGSSLVSTHHDAENESAVSTWTSASASLSEQWVDVSCVVEKGCRLADGRLCESIMDSSLLIEPEAVQDTKSVPGVQLWQRELRVLREMGFTDTATLVPLLAAHFKAPTAAVEGASIDPDSLSRCLNALLNG